MTSHRAPAFSVVIPAFGGEVALRRALLSCAEQTYTDFEVIVVDDHSALPLHPVIEGMGDARFTCVRNPENLGAAASRNVGMRLARGRYVLFIDADDVMLPTRIEAVSKCLDDMPDLLLHRQFRVFDPRPASFAYEVLPRASMAAGDDLAAFAFRNGDFYNMNVFVVRRELLSTVSFRHGLRLYEDQAFIFDCYAASKRTIVMDAALSIYMDDDREHRASRSFRDAEDLAAFFDYARGALSPTAVSYIEAAVQSERGDRLSAFLPTLLHAWRKGLPARRVAYYLLRRVVGQRTASWLRTRARRGGGTQALPDWAARL